MRRLPFLSLLLAALTLSACGATPTGSISTPAAPASNLSAGVSSPDASSTGSPEEPPPECSAPGFPAPAPEPPDPVRELLDGLTLEERVGQLFFVRCPDRGALEDLAAYHLGGYLLFTRDFQDADGIWLTADAFTSKIASWQEAAAIPLFIGVDEEGGSVVRASRNPNLFPGGKYHGPQWLASHGVSFAEDAAEKSAALLSLGVNVNFAPVCDVSTDPGAFIYDRTLGKGPEETSSYVSAVAAAMAESGIGGVLKHFPGYGDNADTHTGIAVDKRPAETFETSDFLPFRAGIAAGGDSFAVLVSHTIAECFDAALPASLSPAVHRVLREDLAFDGPVMTDDLAMDAVSAYAGNGAVAVMALQAGNDLVVTTDYRTQIPSVLEAVETGSLDRKTIDEACYRVLRWKAALGLLSTNSIS